MTAEEKSFEIFGSSNTTSFLLLAKPEMNPTTYPSDKEVKISEVNNSVIKTQSVVPISLAAFPLKSMCYLHLHILNLVIYFV